jgi:hypothetical protein
MGLVHPAKHGEPSILRARGNSASQQSPKLLLDLPMKNAAAVRNYFVLPCCLLLLNLGNVVVSYKAQMVRDGMIRTALVIGMVLFGSSVVAFVLSPAIEVVVGRLHAHSRRAGGFFGEFFFLFALGLLVFWLYFRLSTIGPASIVPPGWRNGRG